MKEDIGWKEKMTKEEFLEVLVRGRERAKRKRREAKSLLRVYKLQERGKKINHSNRVGALLRTKVTIVRKKVIRSCGVITEEQYSKMENL